MQQPPPPLIPTNLPVLPPTKPAVGTKRRGRPPNYMRPVNLPPPHAPAGAPPPALWQPPPPAPPPPRPAPRRVRVPEPYDITRLPALPPWSEVRPAISKLVPVHAGPANPAFFAFDMKWLVLTSAHQIDLWIDQVEAMASASSCLREMTTQFTAFPKPGTVEAFICQTRFMSCWHILTETISGPVWAYMRALGYNKIPVFKDPDGVQWQPGPVDAFYFARQAGYRLNLPGSTRQARIEVAAMVEELRVAKAEDYPSEAKFKKGYAWLKNILDNMIRNGDRQVQEALYDARPDWAPVWPDGPMAETPWVLRGTALETGSKKELRQENARIRKKQARAEARAEAAAAAAAAFERQEAAFYYQRPEQAPPQAPPSSSSEAAESPEFHESHESPDAQDSNESLEVQESDESTESP
ncbi:hypothetical protein B0T26DRAFT_748337 [Lasiosphaeria miniovina]|uniref:Uncharacterized protein n=1 Tax=Lasiosphaeria miniovina TaxID=1954250 RepID=A0AA40B5H5_9PEZI|nr:uncharacterized protein B0T26DRAFT_748337 [Lasiosphaeria miniovina]KAK0728066.1 hypothetical protein B0T26DRAFT_748337 [Lasiosphaeria miniovina]